MSYGYITTRISHSLLCVLTCMLYLWPLHVTAESSPPSGFLDFNVYPYTSVKNDSVVTLNALSSLPSNFEYFSFTNLIRGSSTNSYTDLDRFYTEQNIRWRMLKDIPLQLTTQLVLRSGDESEIYRLGLRYAIHELPLAEKLFRAAGILYWVNVHGAQFDHQSGYQWQIEHAFRWSILSDIFDNRLYLGGFADHAINNGAGSKSTWVEEAQLGYRIWDSIYLVAEQRYNGFRRNERNALGVGLEYNFRF